VAEAKKYDISGPDGPIIFRELPEGMKIKLNTGAVAEITGNPGDGAFLLVKILEHPSDPSLVGEEQTAFFVDVKEVGV
jgi:hypothetical protein